MNRWLGAHATATGIGLFSLTIVLVGLTLTGPGITWDEPAYFESARLQVEWFKSFLTEPSAALERDTVFRMWDWDHYHNPHPPIYKEAMALTWSVTGWLIGPLAAFRLASTLLFAGLIAIAFRWGSAAWSGIGGLGAALSILLMPRLFGHAHLGATETPLMAFWFAATAAGWWAVERKRTTGWFLAGIAGGLAAGTKFTGVLALLPLLVWGMWRDPRATAKGAGWAALAATVTFTALNPMLWVDPVAFLRTWLWESLHRGEYAPVATYYLGRAYAFSVPWHHAFVMTAAVTPLGILTLAGMGAVSGLRRIDPLVTLSALTVCLLWATMLLPRAPHHNGVRMFIPLFPFLGMLAGYGLHWAWSSVRPRVRGLVLTLAFVPAAVQLAWVHPLELAYYGEAVGSVRGAHRLGFESTYWMDAFTEPVLDWMNTELPEGTRVWVFGDATTLELQQTYGRLRSDIQLNSDAAGAEWALVQMWQGIMVPGFLQMVENTEPEYALQLQGVTLVAIYRLD